MRARNGKPVRKDNQEFAGFVRRAIRAHARRIAEDGDVAELATMLALQAEFAQAIDKAVAGLREVDERTGRPAYSWADIADNVGISRQAAFQRWGGKK